MPRISVLIPVYNSEKYLREAIDSILGQTFSDFELILINDASTDSSEEIILSYQDERIRYYRNEENIGILGTRMRLIGKATGEYIAYLDNDDIALPERFAKEIDFLDNNPEYALCGTWGLLVDSDGKYLKKMNLPDRNDEIKSGFLFANCFIQSSMMFRREILVQNPYDVNFPLAKDYNLWYLLSEKHKLCNLPIHLIKYRWHQSNESKKKEDLMTSLTKKVYTKQLVRLGINPTEEELNIHHAIGNKDSLNIPEKEYFKKLNQWMRKLSRANKEHNTYRKDIFTATICFRWIFACKERGTYFKALRFPVFPSPNSLKCLFRLLWMRTK